MSDDTQGVNEVVPPELQTIGDVTYSPGTDLPFGKQFRMGVTETVIFESAIEKGYNAGIQAHKAFIKEHDNCSPVMLDDHQFTLVIDHFKPQGMTPFNDGLWRMHFIVGWTCIYLELVPNDVELIS